MLVHVRAGSLPGRQGFLSEPNRFRADGFRAYAGLIIAALLGAIADAALDHQRFLRGSNSIVADPDRLKDSHGNLLFGMWIEAPTFIGRTPKSPESRAEMLRNLHPESIHVGEIRRLRLHLRPDPLDRLIMRLRQRAAMGGEEIRDLLQRILILRA